MKVSFSKEKTFPFFKGDAAQPLGVVEFASYSKFWRGYE
jgi:hypothetical protein